MALGVKLIKIAFLGDASGLKAAATSGTSSLNKFAIGVAAGAVAAGAKMVKMAADFQSSTTRLVTSAGESQQGLKVVQNGILNLTGKVGDSAQELSAAMYTIESGGQHGAAGLKVLQAAAEGAKAEGADLATVSDAVTSVLQDYHLSADQAALVTSKMVAAVGAGKTTFEQFAGSLSSVLPLASQAGISFDDISAAIASMTVHGVSAEQATQNLADVIRHMLSPTQVQTKELAQLGVNSQDLAKMLSTKGLTGTLQFLSQTILKQMGPSGQVLLKTFNQSTVAAQSVQTMLKALPPNLQKLANGFLAGSISLADWRKDLKALPADQAALLTQFQSTANSANGFSDALKSGSGSAQNYQAALSKVTGDATGLAVALQLTGENTAYVQGAVAKVSAATTEAGNHVAGWGDIQKTFNQRLAETKDTLNAVAIRIGTALLPYAQRMIDATGKLVDWFAKNTGVAKGLAIGIGLLAAAFVITRGAMLAANLASKEWWASTKLIQGGAKLAAAAQWLWNASILGFPALWIVAALAAVVAGVILVIKYHKQIGAFFTAVWGGIVSVAKRVGEFFLGWGKYLLPLLGPIGLLGLAAIEVWQHWQSVWGFFKAIGAWFAGPFADFFVALWQGITVGAQLASRILVSIFNLWLFTMRPIGDLALWLWHNAFQPAMSGIAAAATWVWQSAIVPVAAGIRAELQGIADTALWLWHNAIQPAVSGIASAASWLWHSAIQPAFDGIGSAVSTVYNKVISPIFNKISSAASSVGRAVRSAFDGAGSFIGNAFSVAAGLVKGSMNGVISVINGALGAINKVIKQANKVPGVNFPTLPTIPKLAKGGPTLAGRTYIVGERGPELLTMGNTNGHVTPNSQLGGGAVPEVHVYIGDQELKGMIQVEVRENSRQTRRRVLAAGAGA